MVCSMLVEIWIYLGIAYIDALNYHYQQTSIAPLPPPNLLSEDIVLEPNRTTS